MSENLNNSRLGMRYSSPCLPPPAPRRLRFAVR